QVEREAVGGLKRADPALAEHHRLVALLEDVFGRHQQLLQSAREAALDQRRAPAPADLGQKRVVLHVARADLDHVGDLQDRLEASLYGLEIGTMWSTPGVPSRSRRATCSASPIAATTVSSSPVMMCGRAPTPRTRSATVCTSSWVAVGFITIIIYLSFPKRLA